MELTDCLGCEIGPDHRHDEAEDGPRLTCCDHTHRETQYRYKVIMQSVFSGRFTQFVRWHADADKLGDEIQNANQNSGWYVYSIEPMAGTRECAV